MPSVSAESVPHFNKLNALFPKFCCRNFSLFSAKGCRLIYLNVRGHFSLPAFESFSTSDERFECSVCAASEALS